MNNAELITEARSPKFDSMNCYDFPEGGYEARDVNDLLALLADALEAATYPRDEDPFIVLGSEIFTDQSRDVLCWKGENYVRCPNEPVVTMDGENK